MKLAGVLALCAFGAVSGTETTKSTTNKHRRATGTELFLSIVGEKPNGKSNIKSPILPVQLPIQLGGQGGVTLPVLVVPVPIYVNNADTCSASHQDTASAEPQSLPKIQIIQNRQPFTQDQTRPETQQFQNRPETQDQNEHENYIKLEPIKNQGYQTNTHQAFQNKEQYQNTHDAFQINEQLQNIQPIRPHQPETYTSHKDLNLNLGNSGNRVSFTVNEHQAPVSFAQVVEEKIPYSDGLPIFDTSEQMIQGFIRQSPVAPELPAVIPALDLPDRLPAAAPSPSYGVPSINAAAPPRPDFNRSLRLRVDLNVPSSDYTEAYNIQFHFDSNTAETVIEDGSTIIYRAPLADGRIQFLQIQRELTDGQVVRRCTLSPQMPASPADKTFPGLPDFEEFQFIGYTSAEGRSLVERWRRVVKGGPGEGGAADGESLTFTHEMFITRDRGLAVPLRYTVITDSSILGPNSDSYTHRYNLLEPPTTPVLPDTSRDCDTFDDFQDHEVHAHSHDHGHQKRDIGSLLTTVASKFNPLREFSGPTRDVRYDSILTKYKKQFKRKYLDPAEEALRKTLLVKSSRFINAGNRLASGFKMATNFMADRLDEEITQLFGYQEPTKGTFEPGLIAFPYSENEVRNIKVEEEFDWRPIGAVSPVRFQDTTCSSCWAFAVAGSTEGALFKKTNKLVPLSPQCLVDCGKPFGTNGCNGTWPSYAYDYVQARGLPAWDEYTNYQAKVLECKDRAVPPVTHISGHVNVTSNSEAALKLAIRDGAPTVVIVDAKAQSFIYYKSGVLKDKRCGQNKPRLNHAVLAVGWGTKNGPHFIIKNTWTTKWGEGGYIRIAPDSCAVLERPSYSLVEEPNIDREELRAAAASLKAQF